MGINSQELNDIILNLRKNFSVNSLEDCQSLLMLIYLRDYLFKNEIGQSQKMSIQQLQDLAQSQLGDNQPKNFQISSIPQKFPDEGCSWDQRSKDFQFWVRFMASPLLNKSLNYKEK